MNGSLLGTRVHRSEDPDLLTGRGLYVGDLHADGLCHAAFVRSTVAHARIVSVDIRAAHEAPGVLEIFTAKNLEVAPFHTVVKLHGGCARPPLADGVVRFVGEPIAMIIAFSESEAEDAAERVIVEYEALPTVLSPTAALDGAAPILFEGIGSNLVARYASSIPDPLQGAEVVIRARLENQRIAVVPMEGDAILAIPNSGGSPADMTIYASTQAPHSFARRVSEILGISREEVRVIAPYVGGGFGSKVGLAAEHAGVIVAAKKLRRPIVWVQGRSENLISMPHGRGQEHWVEIGFDRAGTITGMRLRVLADGGAYAGLGGQLALGPTRIMAQGVYAIPAIRYDAAVVVTNTTPVGAFRGAGRPEATELLERMMDIAAGEFELDPIEIRCRNLIPEFESPFTTAVGTTYDTGNYRRALEEAARLAHYETLRSEQRARREAGARWQLGIGVSCYVEVTAGGNSQEFASLTILRDGSAKLLVGTSSHGQGHATPFAMIVSDTLGIPLGQIRLIEGDTGVVPRGGGTGGSRSLQIGGSAILAASREVLAYARKLAATALEADPEDIVLHEEGGLGVAGVPSRTLSWGELAVLSEDESSGPEGAHPLQAMVDFTQDGATFPFGAHISVVEVDLETGQVRPLRHIAVDDCGRIANPLLVEGQQHGGAAQGMAQALWEGFIYTADGTPLTTNLADYPIPSAVEVPSFDAHHTETPSPLNPLGAKGIGESATVGATPAVHNAVVDALSYLGVRHVDMPCTPERVWRSILAAKGGEPCERPLWSIPPLIFDNLSAAEHLNAEVT